ncbi:GNAT family N-acetyltransferase [Kocuria sp. M1R5S2]|uniref:GNAT family N-acetyltransferase n=1 Tax=Kocuria rhizosphaerae TaxID=3376285 RepID=UPI0037900B3E
MSDGAAVVVRAWDDDDARATLEVFRRAVHGTARHDYTPEQLAAWAPGDMPLADWAGRRREAATVVAELAGRVVGFGDLDPAGHVGMLYVDPSAARTGVASALLEHLVAQAHRRGLAELSTHASITALPFFERHGFVVVEERRPVRRGVAMTNFAMRRQLAAPGDGARIDTADAPERTSGGQGIAR